MPRNNINTPSSSSVNPPPAGAMTRLVGPPQPPPHPPPLAILGIPQPAPQAPPQPYSLSLVDQDPLYAAHRNIQASDHQHAAYTRAWQEHQARRAQQLAIAAQQQQAADLQNPTSIAPCL